MFKISSVLHKLEFCFINLSFVKIQDHETQISIVSVFINVYFRMYGPAVRTFAITFSAFLAIVSKSPRAIAS